MVIIGTETVACYSGNFSGEDEYGNPNQTTAPLTTFKNVLISWDKSKIAETLQGDNFEVDCVLYLNEHAYMVPYGVVWLVKNQRYVVAGEIINWIKPKGFKLKTRTIVPLKRLS